MRLILAYPLFAFVAAVAAQKCQLPALFSPGQPDEAASCAGVLVKAASGAPECRIPGDGLPFRDCKDEFCAPEMVVVPAGAFDMGTPESDTLGYKWERPVRPVTIAKPFALGRFEVTVKEYMACVSANKTCAPPAWKEAGGEYNIETGSNDFYKKFGAALTADNYPIVGVSWENARTYAGWLNGRLGLAGENGYGLPSEARWEYAARGGKGPLRYWWGGEASHEQANYTGTQGRDEWKYTSPVDKFPANPWGLHDMHGNVWEWVEDCYWESYTDMPDAVKITGAAWLANCQPNSPRVLRGGSWSSVPRALRSAIRGSNPPDFRYYGIGFRLARALTP